MSTSTTNHTPGPWLADRDDSLGSVWGQVDGEWEIIVQAQQLRMNDRWTLHAERIANTRLIAQAPALLDALVAANKLLTQVLVLEHTSEIVDCFPGGLAQQIREAVLNDSLGIEKIIAAARGA